MKRNERGVTLIALVVTIVVLLILAGTAIAMLSGDDGIMTNAQRAQAANTEGEIREKFQMAFNAVKTEIDVNSALDSSYNATSTTDAEGATLSTIAELFQKAADEIGVPVSGNSASGDGITMKLNTTAHTIFMEYTDNKFGGGTDTSSTGVDTTYNNTPNFANLPNGTQEINGKKLKAIRALIQIEPDGAELLIDPEQVV